MELKTLYRPRRNRKSAAVRQLVQETRLAVHDLIYPVFVWDGFQKEAIGSLPGIFRLSLDALVREVERVAEIGIGAVALFPVIPGDLKDEEGSEALSQEGILFEAIQLLKREFPTLCLIADVALDPYTSHGHDGVLDENGEILNDATVERLVKLALLQAEAGVDMVAPSDMMDGRVRAIREALDEKGFTQVSIHAYSAKYASCFYAPFREALGSKLSFGDKKTYQLNPANQREGLLEALLDEEEGADILMVKPALLYLDVICKLRECTHYPISAFQVSGEYAMIMAAAQNEWLNAERAFYESVLSIKRAGADMIFTYAAPKLAELITSGALD
jgi:porphobilinogen synthase